MDLDSIVEGVQKAFYNLEAHSTTKSGSLSRELKDKVIYELQRFPNAVKPMDKFLEDIGDKFDDDPDCFVCRMPVTLEVFKKALARFLTGVEFENSKVKQRRHEK